MATFPGGIVSLNNPTSGDSLNTTGVTHAAQHANVNDEVEAIEVELGTNPSAGFSTVAARFTAVESDVSDLAADVAGLPGGDPTVFHVDSYGAVGNGTTDDTAAVLAAIAAADAAGGGTVQFGAKTYLCNGSLLTTENGYAVLPLPSGRNPIRLRGVQPANQCDPRTDTGYSVIKTTKTGLTRSGSFGVPSLIGGPTDSTWSDNMVSIENLCLWLPKNPTIAGIDLLHVRRCLVDGVSVIAINTGDSDYTQPTSTYAFGLRTPAPQNYNTVLIRSGQAHGMYAGLVGATESLTASYWVSKWCVVGWAPMTGGHGGVALKMSLEWCTYHVSGWSETGGVGAVATGPNGETSAQVHVSELAIEDAAAGHWYTTTAHINDSSDRIKGVVFFDRYDGTGPSSTLTKTGGANLTAVSLLAPSFGGGSTIYTKRDRLTAAAGNTVLTLGATPVNDSVHVWVDNVIKWPVVNYTRSGAVVTFGSALTAGQVVLVSYETTNSSASNAVLSTTVGTFNDTVMGFTPLGYWKHDTSDSTRPDSSGSSRTLTVSGVISVSQTSLLASGAGTSALFNGGHASIASAAWMETDYVSVVMRYQPRTGDLTGNKALLTRWLGGTSTDFAWLFWLSSGKVQGHAKPHGGTAVSAIGTTTLVAGTNYTIGMTFNGSAVKVYVNGVEEGTAALSGVLQKSSGAPVDMAGISGAASGGGYFDEVALFGTALSGTDMTNLHTAAITA